jgi:hypothetical protein
MKARIKIPNAMLDEIRDDLHRPHAFAYERVGFMTAGVTQAAPGQLLLLARAYRRVADEDYVPDPTVGAKIGSDAMRKAVQFAYQPRSALLHIHSHGGHGRPNFSGVDLTSGAEFVPGFFHSVPRMPHGMLVMSNNSATGMLWFGPEETGTYVAEFVGVGTPYRKFGMRHELA